MHHLLTEERPTSYWTFCNIGTSHIPFIGNNNSEEDGAVEDDVIDRVDELGEEDGIHLTVVGERPLELCNILFAELFRNADKRSKEVTSSHAIVKNSKDDEENVKDGENNEEKVERVSHLLGAKNKNCQKVPQNTKRTNTGLRFK